MKKYLLPLCLTICFICYTEVINAQIFMVQDGTYSTPYSNLKAAIDAAPAGSTVYIPAGTFVINDTWTGYDGTSNISNTLCINKPLNIIGAGYNQGSNTSYLKTGTLLIGKDATGIKISGLQLDFLHLDDVSDVIVTRCWISTLLKLGGTGTNNIFTECQILVSDNRSYGYFSGTIESLTAMFNKCIFDQKMYCYVKNSTLTNCIFHNIHGGQFQYCTFEYNVFVYSTSGTGQTYNAAYGGAGNTNNTFTNNLTIGATLTSGVENNNTISGAIDDVAYTDAFVNPTAGNFHIKPTCAAYTAGPGGTEVGIYGTASPFKENKRPSNPQFIRNTIGIETNSEGKLVVDISVEAQSN